MDSLQLKKLMSESNYQDNSEKIRTLKHSSLIRGDIEKLVHLKKLYKSHDLNHSENIKELFSKECNFITLHYPDLFNKLYKDELEIELAYKFLNVLKMIEENEIDQHQGSVIVGTILKEIYVDSALKKANKLDHPEHEFSEEKKISWSEFKKLN